MGNIKRIRQGGFTLLEVMIAVGITAAVGAVSVQLLSGLVESKGKTEIASDRLASLQRFNQVLGRDIQQMMNRPYRDVYGNDAHALIIDGLDYKLEFSRLGWPNSALAKDPRAEIQRVAYQTYSIDSEECEDAKQQLEDWGVFDAEEDCLVRHYWLVLDRSADSLPRSQVILEQITSLEVEVWAKTLASGEGDEQQGAQTTASWYTQWPALNTGENKETPQAIRWTMELPRFGEIERLWAITYDDQ